MVKEWVRRGGGQGIREGACGSGTYDGEPSAWPPLRRESRDLALLAPTPSLDAASSAMPFINIATSTPPPMAPARAAKAVAAPPPAQALRGLSPISHTKLQR